MAFRYINPGYAALIGDDASQTFSKEYSKTGVSFTTSSSYIPVITKNLTTDLYCRFDFFLDNYSGYIKLGAVSTYGKNSLHSINTSGTEIYLCYRGYYIGDDITFETNSINHAWFHWHFSGSSDTSFGEIKVNDTTHYVSLSGLNYYGFQTPSAAIKLIAKGSYVSNIIISDEYISPKEETVILPTLETETNMTAGESGIYVANAVNQQLLQSVDVAQLIETYGASAVITGIQLVGNPTYKIGAGSASLVGLIKNGASIAEQGTFELTSDTNAAIFDSCLMENISIAELSSMQFGWKIGT